jgi:malate dehydrogenase (oxaloacetate-decarboxylating)(NADP+)
MGLVTKEEAFEYHSRGRKGKIEVVTTKPCLTQKDLSLAYTPGVAQPCLAIEKDPELAYEYTAKGNLVAVISNGTAVLGLGDIGALAGKPVMEGKGVLFKRFADIDVFDIEINTHDPDEVIKFCQLIEPTLGGINLEDIKAPECFYIEEELKKTMGIPVFHDDQHGTAIISAAGLINALEIVGKDPAKVKVVMNGAGASSVSCAKLYEMVGVKHENIFMVDTKGVIYKGRTEGMNKYKEYFIQDTKARTLMDIIKGADVFVGLSVKGALHKEMVAEMAKDAIIFAMANPDPEITPEDAFSVRKDIIMATGRSDYPNQVNNVLGFPFIFRGALDVRATAINEEMKIAASKALAALAKEDVPDSVIKAYGGKPIKFGREYIIPKPFDYRVLLWEAPAVAKAAVRTGVAKRPIQDWDAYIRQLEARLFKSRTVLYPAFAKAKAHNKTIIFPEGENDKIVRAAKIAVDEGLAKPILLGSAEVIVPKLKEFNLPIDKVEVIDPKTSDKREVFARKYAEVRKRKGASFDEAKMLMNHPNYFGCMMVEEGLADGLLSGLTMPYPDTIRPALRVNKTRADVKKVAGLYLLILKDRIVCMADTTVNVNPTAEELAEIAKMAAEAVRFFDIEPKIAFISYSNFGTNNDAEVKKVQKAVELAKQLCPDTVIEGEMQVDPAVHPETAQQQFPWSAIQGDANVLIFPTLDAANAAYKLVWRLSDAEAIGPILMGVSKPVHILQRGVEVNDIVNMIAVCAADAVDRQGAAPAKPSRKAKK